MTDIDIFNEIKKIKKFIQNKRKLYPNIREKLISEYINYYHKFLKNESILFMLVSLLSKKKNNYPYVKIVVVSTFGRVFTREPTSNFYDDAADCETKTFIYEFNTILNRSSFNGYMNRLKSLSHVPNYHDKIILFNGLITISEILNGIQLVCIYNNKKITNLIRTDISYFPPSGEPIPKYQ